MNWTIPNLLSIIRVLAAPCVAISFTVFERPEADQIAVLIFVGAAATDYLDGWLARILRQESAFGRMLDPIADKLLVAVAILVLVADGMLTGWSIWAAIIVLMREILVSGLREYLAEIQVPLPVSRLAKWKTVLQMIALGFLVVGDSAGPEGWPVDAIGNAGLWIAAVLTLITGYDYLVRGLEHVNLEDPPR